MIPFSLFLAPRRNLWVSPDDDYSRQAAKHAKESLIFLDQAIDGAGDAILHHGRTEIQQIAQPHPREAEVSEELLPVGVVELCNTLELHNDLVLDDEVRAEAFIELKALVLDGDGNLSFNP